MYQDNHNTPDVKKAIKIAHNIVGYPLRVMNNHYREWVTDRWLVVYWQDKVGSVCGKILFLKNYSIVLINAFILHFVKFVYGFSVRQTQRLDRLPQFYKTQLQAVASHYSGKCPYASVHPPHSKVSKD